MISIDINWQNHLPTPYFSTEQGKKKTNPQNLSISGQEIEIIGNVLNEHSNLFAHNFKWWYFHILLLAGLLPSDSLVFLAGEYKYSTTTAHPLEGTT